jgi:hypothetical protein
MDGYYLEDMSLTQTLFSAVNDPGKSSVRKGFREANLEEVAEATIFWRRFRTKTVYASWWLILFIFYGIK